MFKDADADGSGKLDKAELASLLKEYYKTEKLSRRLSSVQEEIDAAMAEYDTDGNGELDFKEFIFMAATSKEFKFRLTQMEKKEMLLCLERQTGAFQVEVGKTKAASSFWG